MPGLVCTSFYSKEIGAVICDKQETDSHSSTTAMSNNSQLKKFLLRTKERIDYSFKGYSTTPMFDINRTIMRDAIEGEGKTLFEIADHRPHYELPKFLDSEFNTLGVTKMHIFRMRFLKPLEIFKLEVYVVEKDSKTKVSYRVEHSYIDLLIIMHTLMSKFESQYSTIPGDEIMNKPSYNFTAKGIYTIGSESKEKLYEESVNKVIYEEKTVYNYIKSRRSLKIEDKERGIDFTYNLRLLGRKPRILNSVKSYYSEMRKEIERKTEEEKFLDTEVCFIQLFN